MTRPYTGLALGLAVHGLEPGTKTAAVVIKGMRATLARLLRHGRGSDEVLGASAVGLGLAGAESEHKLLLEVLKDRRRSAALRAHCALALAQIGCRTTEVRAALHAAAAERVSPRVHLAALGLLYDPEPRPSRVLLTQHANNPARTAGLAQIFNIQ